MNTRSIFLATIILVITIGSKVAAEGSSDASRQVMRINFDWEFRPGGLGDGVEKGEGEGNWQTVQLPHDVSIYGPFVREGSDKPNGWRPRSQGWYRKTFTLPKGIQSKKVLIEFEGVYRDARVWINGAFLGRHLNGYLGFEHDLTPHINWTGKNFIAVHYDNRTPDTSRWYTGEGIYRDVWLKIVDPLHVPRHGTCVTTPKIERDWAIVRVETEVLNQRQKTLDVRIETEIVDNTGEVVTSAPAAAPLASDETYIFRQELKVQNHQLWDVENPHLYCVVTKVFDDENQTDRYETRFGIREVRLATDRGLLLNGRKVLALGGDIHHDLGCLGAATFRRGYEKRLKTLQAMGCNSIRLSHNPHATMVLDLCDELGILVIDELYDKWTSQFYGGEASYAEMWRTDLEHLIRRDRNHPSVYIWSMGNEVLKQHGNWDEKFETEADGADYGVSALKEMVDFTHRLEPTRKVTCALYPLRETGIKEWESWDNHDEFMATAPPPMAFYMDVVSWNYTENQFDLDHANYPQMMFIASESGTNLQFGVRKNSWIEIDPSYLIGYYYWAAWDYLGESVWPQKTWARAFYDLGEKANPLGAMYRGYFSAEPFVQIWVYEQDEAILEQWDKQFPNKRWSWYPMASHWNWKQYPMVKVATFTSCDSVELLVNGESLGVQKRTDFEDLNIEWDVPYEAGTIRAIARMDDGRQAEHELHTAGKPVQISLVPDRYSIKADGLDLAYIDATLIDDQGVVVPNADKRIRFQVEGAGTNAGVATGDFYSDEPFQGDQRSTDLGHCLLVVRSSREEGTANITATADGLPAKTLEIEISK